MERFDELIIEEVSGKLFTRERMCQMLTGLRERQAAKREENSGHLDSINAELSDAELNLKRIYAAIGSGIIDPTDPTLQEQIAETKERRDFAKAARERAMVELAPEAEITDETIERFTNFVRHRLRDGDNQFKRSYLRAVLDKIVVNDNSVKIVGDRRNIEAAAISFASGASTVSQVPISVRNWLGW